MNFHATMGPPAVDCRIDLDHEPQSLSHARSHALSMYYNPGTDAQPGQRAQYTAGYPRVRVFALGLKPSSHHDREQRNPGFHTFAQTLVEDDEIFYAWFPNAQPLPWARPQQVFPRSAPNNDIASGYIGNAGIANSGPGFVVSSSSELTLMCGGQQEVGILLYL